jgi:hypothetical protein
MLWLWQSTGAWKRTCLPDPADSLPFELAILQFWGGKGGKREKKEKKEKKKTLVGLSGVCCATRCCVRCAPLS